jgi:hypothetical protein
LDELKVGGQYPFAIRPTCRGAPGNEIPIPATLRKPRRIGLPEGQTLAHPPVAKRQYALLALMCLYCIELLADNIAECRASMLEILAECLNIDDSEGRARTAS